MRGADSALIFRGVPDPFRHTVLQVQKAEDGAVARAVPRGRSYPGQRMSHTGSVCHSVAEHGQDIQAACGEMADYSMPRLEADDGWRARPVGLCEASQGVMVSHHHLGPERHSVTAF